MKKDDAVHGGHMARGNVAGEVSSVSSMQANELDLSPICSRFLASILPGVDSLAVDSYGIFACW